MRKYFGYKNPILMTLACSVVLTGCSVAMAAKHKGVRLDEATQCKARSCFLSLRDMEVLSSAAASDGGMIETYKILLEQGSTGRAVMHGLLDVATLGIWEVAGTPIEGSASKDKFVIVTVTYDQTGTAKNVAMGDAMPQAQPQAEPQASAAPAPTATPAPAAEPTAEAGL